MKPWHLSFFAIVLCVNVCIIAGCATPPHQCADEVWVETDNGNELHIQGATGWADVVLPVGGSRITFVQFFDRQSDLISLLPRQGIRRISHHHAAPRETDEGFHSRDCEPRPITIQEVLPKGERF